MPNRVVHCKICKASISGYNFGERMRKLRHHYANKHPYAWAQSIKRGVAKRKANK